MKKLRKIGMILKNTSGETMVEVIVAFTLLSIMMVVFSQGLASATTSEVNAKKNRDSADNSMIKLQQKLASEEPYTAEGDSIDIETGTNLSAGSGYVTPYTYTIDGNTYVVFSPATT